MSNQDLWAFCLPCLIFLILSFWYLYKMDRKPITYPSYTCSNFESRLHFSFGDIWIYDSDPINKEQKENLVFIHSIGSSIYSWRYQIPACQKNYRLIAFDLLGFGKSSKPLEQKYDLDAQADRIITILDRLKVEKCNLIGCSLGGALSLWLASQHKNRFASVVAIAPAATTNLVPPLPFKHQKLSSFANTLSSRTLIRLALMNGYSYRKNITPDVIDHYFSPFSERTAMSCFLRTVEAIKDPRIFLNLKNISQPVLLLWGTKDKVVRKNNIKQIADELKNSQFVSHPTGGHHLMEDEPEWINQKILSFIENI